MSGREVHEPCVHANVVVGEVLEPCVRDNVAVGEVPEPCVYTITWPSEKCLSPVEAQLAVRLGSC